MSIISAIRADRRKGAPPAGGSVAEWLDRQTKTIFILPAILIILAFSIFPTLASGYLALSRIRLREGYELRFVGLRNFEKLLFGSDQYHFLGTFDGMGPLGYVVTVATVLLIGYWFWGYFQSGKFSIIGFVGRIVTAATLGALLLLLAATMFSGNPFGSLPTTLFYMVVGCTFQFAIGLGLALLCAQNIRGRSFFRVVFFLPLMITPAGIAYIFRMLADTSVGPFAAVWGLFGLEGFAWGAEPWSARIAVVVSDSWQWIPFIFIVLLAAIENVPRDPVEAAHVDGAGPLTVFREVIWPEIAPVAATVMLIRVIEAFKIIDMPNIITNGGPGIATESMTLHSFISWRALDFGNSAAVAYALLFVSLILCVSYFNLVVQAQRRVG